MEKLNCDVCGKTGDEISIDVHSAMGLPVSFCYCENCDKNGYITHWELIKYLSRSQNKDKIVENIDFIIENCKAIRKGLRI